MVYTISYHNIIVNINVVRYVSLQIMMGRYFNTRGKGVHSIVVYTILYHNIIVNINVVGRLIPIAIGYVSVQIMMGRYFNTRGKGVHVVLWCIQYCIITLL